MKHRWKNLTAACVVLLCMATLHHARAQHDPILLYASKDTVKYLTGISTNGVPWCQYLEVGNYFDDVAPTLVIGELAVSNNLGRRYLSWSDPRIQSINTDEFVPVYQYNSNTYAHELVTKPFALHPGDTLSFFRNSHLTFPVEGQDEPSNEERDSSIFRIPDTVSFRVQLLSAATGNEIIRLEDHVFRPVSGFSEYINALVSDIIASAPDSLSNHFLYARRFTAGDLGPDSLFRLRVAPIYEPQLRNRFDDRAFYARYYLEERVSDRVQTYFDSVRATAEYIAFEQSLPKRPGRHPYAEADETPLTISPTIQRRGSICSISVGDGMLGVEVSVRLHDLFGKMYKAERRKASEDAIQFALPHGVLPGIYIVTVEYGTRMRIGRIIVY